VDVAPKFIVKIADRSRPSIAFLGGALAWLIHFLFLYLFGEWGCRGSLLGVFWWVLGVTVLFGGIAAVSLLESVRLRRLTRLKHGATDEERIRANDFFADFGIISNAIFLLTIVVQALPVFFLMETC
jgi:hypothetical protein